MQHIAIIGTGPTGIYTLFYLLKSPVPLAISLYEKQAQAGVGMPFSEEKNSNLMLANIASIEIPPIESTYLQWLKEQDAEFLRQFGVDNTTLHDRQFLPRILLGKYFRDQLLALIDSAQQKGFRVTVHEGTEVVDLEAADSQVRLWVEGASEPAHFDRVVIASGHVWPTDAQATRNYFPSPWSGLLEAQVPACKVGIMGTSLSAIDAAMAVVAQHGAFCTDSQGTLQFRLAPHSAELSITLMSRSGILPEADFYCPIPYTPLEVATPAAIAREIEAGQHGLLDRVFALIAQEISLADPDWSRRVGLANLNADDFADAYFRDRKKHAPFYWAEYNLAEVERNRMARKTVPWRYAILRLHEAVQDIVPHLSEADRTRFMAGLCKVFVDNYAAIPPESIRRLLALHAADVVDVLSLGNDYTLDIAPDKTVIATGDGDYHFNIFIDARGQRPLKTRDLPFPTLRRQLSELGEDIPDLGEDYTLLHPESARGRVAFAALPYLMHDQPFVQGITACAAIGKAVAQAVASKPARARRRLLAEEV